MDVTWKKVTSIIKYLWESKKIYTVYVSFNMIPTKMYKIREKESMLVKTNISYKYEKQENQ